MFTLIAYADSVDNFFFKVNARVINPAIEFIFIIAFVIFLWGVMEYIRGASNEEKRRDGREHMLWGIVGFIIMFGVWGIINILVNTFGITGTTFNQNEQKIQVDQKLQEINIPQ